MTDPTPGFTPAERQALLVMTRWAVETRHRRLHWAVPNDSTWPGEYLASYPVRYTGMPDQFELVGRRRWRPERVVATMWRTDDGPRVDGVPGEEWLRPSNQVAADDAGEVPEPPPRRPVSARPRVLAAAGLVAVVPFAAGVGIAVNSSGVDRSTPPVVAQAPAVPAPSPVATLPAGTKAWASQARVRLASMDNQLDTLAAAQDRWAALPPERRRQQPPALAELQHRWADLIAVRGELAADLDAYDRWTAAQHRLVETDRRLAQVSTAGPSSGELAAEAERLRADAEQARAEAAEHREQVMAAAAAPVTDVPPVDPVADRVLALAAEPAPPEQQPAPAPAVAAGREAEPDTPQPVVVDDGEPEPDDEDRDRSVAVDTPAADVNVVGDEGVSVEAPGVNVSVGSDDERDRSHDGGEDRDVERDRGEEQRDVEQDEPEPETETTLEPVEAHEPEPVEDTEPAPEPEATPTPDLQTPEGQEQFRTQVDEAVDGFVAEHQDEVQTAAAELEDLTLEEALTQDGETPQQMRDRLAAAAQDYQAAAGG